MGEEVEGIRVTDTGAFILLPMPTSPSTLQDLIEAWTFQHHIYGLTGEWPRVPVVLGRYTGRAKNQARVLFDGSELVSFGTIRTTMSPAHALLSLVNMPATFTFSGSLSVGCSGILAETPQW